MIGGICDAFGPRSRASRRAQFHGLALSASIAIAGCQGPEVRDRLDNLGEVETTASCTHPGICLTCLPGYDMKMNCGLKFSPYCTGSEPAIGTRYRERFHYERKPEIIYSREFIGNIRTTGGTCS